MSAGSTLTTILKHERGPEPTQRSSNRQRVALTTQFKVRFPAALIVLAQCYFLFALTPSRRKGGSFITDINAAARHCPSRIDQQESKGKPSSVPNIFQSCTWESRRIRGGESVQEVHFQYWMLKGVQGGCGLQAVQQLTHSRFTHHEQAGKSLGK
jgi:hypothetical protein